MTILDDVVKHRCCKSFNDFSTEGHQMQIRQFREAFQLFPSKPYGWSCCEHSGRLEAPPDPIDFGITTINHYVS